MMAVAELLSPAARRDYALYRLRRQATATWRPNPDRDGQPNPQRIALESPADEVFYGGQAGGGKSDLLLGCAIAGHARAVIFRRTFPNLKALIDRSLEILGESGFHKTQNRHKLSGGRFLEFGYMQREDDKKNWQGRAHDFYGFDEITEFSRTQYQFVTGWNRTTDPRQRCRVIAVGNPPIDADGMWVVEEWAPWLDPAYHDPAAPGELRWYYYDADGRLQWQRNDAPVTIAGIETHPRSRTFIPATLQDNPHLAQDGRYASVLNSLPEPLRSAFRDGNFNVMLQGGDPFQIIPTEWVRAAQRRWLERERPEGNSDAAGHDVSRGGQDKTTLVERWGNYLDITGAWPGAMVDDGPKAAALVHDALGGRTPGVLNVDIIGYGSSSYDSLRGMGYNAVPVNVAAGSSYTDRSGKLTMFNLRAELLWRMRDALDPGNGSDLSLPADTQVVADLCSARYQLMAGGKVKAESKEDIRRRLGRSPDIGDAILLANYQPRFVSPDSIAALGSVDRYVSPWS